ncbi:MAG: Trk system potassium transporter TrkA [Planctomycetota bacterium]
MRITIVGAGNVGSTLAERLRRENHDIIVIDRDEQRADMLREALDILVVCGNGANPDVLKKAQVRDCEMFLAVTDRDETNLLACVMAHRLGSGRQVARVSTADYFKDGVILPEELGIDLVIHPESECAREIFSLLENPEIFERVFFSEDRVQMVGLTVPKQSPLAGLTLQELPEDAMRESVRVVAIEQEDQVRIPRGDDRIEVGDDVYVVGETGAVEAFQKWAGVATRSLGRVVIVGGGRIGSELAGMLSGSKVAVRMIERDARVAEQIAERHQHVLVLHGDATDPATLKEAGVEGTDCFVAVAGDDQPNILSCVLARQLEAKKTIARINRVEYVDIVSSILKVDVVVSPMLSAVNRVLHFTRRGRTLLEASLKNVDAEVLEVEVTPRGKLAGKHLRELRFPEGALVALVRRGDEVLLGTGERVLRPGDRAIVFALPEAVSQVEQLFSAQRRGKSRSKSS